MKLSVRERFQLMNVLPVEGDLVTIRVINDLRMKLGHTEEEVRAFGIKVEEDGGRVTWDPEKVKDVEIEIGNVATAEIVKALKTLDEQKKVTPELLPLCDKFLT